MIKKDIKDYVDTVDLDNTDFNIGFEQGYMFALDNLLEVIK